MLTLIQSWGLTFIEGRLYMETKQRIMRNEEAHEAIQEKELEEITTSIGI